MAYVYAISVDGVLRYVGKGTGNRAWVHLSGAKRGNRRIAAAVKRGQSVQVTIIQSDLTDAEAFDLEEQMIAQIGREDIGAGPLWNLATGGLGGTREGALRRWADPLFREKARASFSKAQKNSEKNKKNLVWLATDPEVKEKRIAKMTPRQWGPMVEATRRCRADPQWMQKYRQTMKVAHNRPEVIEIKRAAAKVQSDPQLRKLIGDRVRASWARRKAEQTRVGEN